MNKLISNAFANTPSAYLPHLVRSSGSYIPLLTNIEDTRFFLENLTWEQVFPDSSIQFKNCTYFRAKLDPKANVVAYQNICLLEDANDELLKSVKAVRNPDTGKVELISTKAKPVRTHTVHIILGEADNGDDMVFTWYPGKLSASLKQTSTIKLSKNV
jgi:hypothetical protein